MDEIDPAAAPAEPPSQSPPPEVDRSAGLKVFGFFTVMLGFFTAMLIPMMAYQLRTSEQLREAGGPEAGFRQQANTPDTSSTDGGAITFNYHVEAVSVASPAAPPTFADTMAGCCYTGALAVALVWLGAGSFMARRWARALLLIISWAWLLVGIWTMASILYAMPGILRSIQVLRNGQSSDSAVVSGVMIISALVYAVLFVALPVIWLRFYKRPDVKATCEARDPVVRWTDLCPLPVLAVCLFSALAVTRSLSAIFVGPPVKPFFGTFLSGAPAIAWTVAIAAAWSYAAWLLYKLDRRGWWMIFIGACMILASRIATYSRHDLSEIYRLMGHSQGGVGSSKKMGDYNVLISWLQIPPVLGYLAYIKKYLRTAR